MSNRDDFKKPTRDNLARRAAYICSNPDCRLMTVAPSVEVEDGVLYFGRASHITAAAPGGPRYDASLTPQERSHIGNGIYLCANCADMVDDNNGADFSVVLVQDWKRQHEIWVRANLNKQLQEDSVASKMLRRMTGGHSTLFLTYSVGDIMMHIRGDTPLRDVHLLVKDETELTRRIEQVTQAEGAGMNAEQGIKYLDGAVIFKEHFPVVDTPAQSAVSFIGCKVPDIADCEERSYSYRATALNGVFTGRIYLFRRADGKLLTATKGYWDGDIINEFPEKYPKLEDDLSPDWSSFD